MNIISVEDEGIVKEALKCLKSGGILIYPTETCYGVGVDATNFNAVTTILEYKKRPAGKPISVGVATKQMAEEYVEILGSESIFDEFLPGPVTVVCKSKGKVDARLESEKQTLGIRIPDYPLLLEIIKLFGKPITTTSANSSGKKTPYTINDILKNISKKQMNLIHTVIDAGELPPNPPSTVIDVSTQDLKVYRQGAVNIFQNQKIVLKKLTESVEETIEVAREFMSQNGKSDRCIVLLNGSLGAGKTQFVKGLALGLGITQTITSPTYTYMQEYSIKAGKLLHLDMWRVDNQEDLQLLSESEIFNSQNIVAIEWPGIILELDKTILKNKKVWVVNILKKNDNTREITVSKAII